MSESQGTTHTAPGEGESVWLVRDLIEVKLSANDTGGAYTMVEETSPPGGGPPPHLHRDQDEAFCVLEGEVEFLLGEVPSRRAWGRASTSPKAPCTRSRTWELRQARF